MADVDISRNKASSDRFGQSFDEAGRAAQKAVASVSPALKQTIDVSEEMRPVIEGMRPFLNKAARASSLSNVVIEQVGPILAQLSQLPKAEIKPGQFDELRLLVERAYAGVPRFRSKSDDGGWEHLRQASVRWGQFGWAIPMHMSIGDLKRVPNSLEEADERCMGVYRGRIHNLVEHLNENVCAKGDLTEAKCLYEEGRYKTCAMVLCALIEGELISRDPRGAEAEKRKARRSSKNTLDLMKPREASLLGYRLNLLGNAIEVLDYFFKSANNFDRAREGELNRHFLMHGMMRKPVRETTCVKLFFLLDLTTGYLFQQ